MRKSIKTMVGIRVVFAFVAVLVYSLVVTFNVFLIKDAANSSSDAGQMLALDSLELELLCCEPFDMGAGNKTQVLWKNTKCS